ncbi:hypothetical protein ABT061_17815 [Streptosporangium sp. NPDC002544]|uniref:hypothetical protein n=1 Tax=Streptosporangium sp. NPDC002544 TaxID=3154538 RepID=UPI003330CC37
MIITIALSASLLLTGAPAQTSVKTVSFQGFSIQVPSTWRTNAEGSGLRVITGACSKQATECKGFLLGGSDQVKYGHEGGPYQVGQLFHPSSGVMECVPDKKHLESGAKLVHSRNVSFGGKPARYNQFTVSCGTKLSYTQRVWYVKSKKVMVVDHWKTPGLSSILRQAIWK